MAGRYDGTLGVLAGIEVVRVLQENRIKLAHPLEVIVFTDEECSVIGCKALAGNVVNNPEYYRRNDSTPIQTRLELIGGDWSNIAMAQRQMNQITAFVELHVEQGGVLESTGAQIGVVEGIVGQYRHLVTVNCPRQGGAKN